MAISSHDIVPDSPTNTFATLNPLRAGTQNLADGNLKISAKSENHWGTLAVDPADTNKYYFEMLVIAQKAGAQVVGVSNQSGTATNYLGSDANGWGIFFQSNSNNGDLVNSTLSSSGVTFSNGDIVQVCFTASKIWFGKNGTFIGNPDTETSPSFSNLSGTLSPVISNRSDLGGSACINFGQDHLFGGSTFSTAATNAGAGSNTPDNGIGTFAFSPPTGALALCTANLPDFTPDVDDDTPQDYFKAVIWGGNNQSGRQIDTDGIGKGTGFQPDIVWVAIRSGQSSVQTITDSVRQVDSILSPNGTYSVNTFDASWRSSYGQITIFNSTGFQVNKGSATSSNFNSSNEQYVAWCWKAGGAPTADNTATSGAMTANSVSLNGTLQSNYTPAGSPTIYPKRMSINTDAGFSIVKYVGNTTSGATIPHGLSKRPDLIFFKNTNTSNNWIVYNFLTTDSQFILKLNLTDQGNSAANTASWYANNSYFKVEQYNDTNGSGPIIAYCWHSVEGYSKFGSYTGNGSADGPFVYTGFRVGWLMVKATNLTGASSWFIWDSKRSPNNEMKDALLANDSLNELHDREIDFLSNGFKLRANDGNYNQNYTYIFMAFAEQPFKFSNAR
jgi:hypothetical protein